MIYTCPNKLNLDAKVLQKLFKRIDTSSDIEMDMDINMESNCYSWLGHHDSYGRPQFRLNGEYKLAKKIIYQSWYGSYDPDKTIISKCSNKGCVRPDHLVPSFYFYESAYARSKQNKIDEAIVHVNEKKMLEVFNGIKLGRLNNISDIGKYLNIKNGKVVEFLLNDNWMFINKYYTKDDLDQLRFKVMPEEMNYQQSKSSYVRSVLNAIS